MRNQVVTAVLKRGDDMITNYLKRVNSVREAMNYAISSRLMTNIPTDKAWGITPEEYDASYDVFMEVVAPVVAATPEIQEIYQGFPSGYVMKYGIIFQTDSTGRQVEEGREYFGEDRWWSQDNPSGAPNACPGYYKDEPGSPCPPGTGSEPVGRCQDPARPCMRRRNLFGGALGSVRDYKWTAPAYDFVNPPSDNRCVLNQLADGCTLINATTDYTGSAGNWVCPSTTASTPIDEQYTCANWRMSSYNVFERHWYQLGKREGDGGSRVYGPVGSTYSGVDIPNYELDFRLQWPGLRGLDVETQTMIDWFSVTRVKFRVDPLTDSMQEIDVGPNGELWIVNKDGAIVGTKRGWAASVCLDCVENSDGSFSNRFYTFAELADTPAYSGSQMSRVMKEFGPGAMLAQIQGAGLAIEHMQTEVDGDVFVFSTLQVNFEPLQGSWVVAMIYRVKDGLVKSSVSQQRARAFSISTLSLNMVRNFFIALCFFLVFPYPKFVLRYLFMYIKGLVDWRYLCGDKTEAYERHMQGRLPKGGRYRLRRQRSSKRSSTNSFESERSSERSTQALHEVAV
jgi:hypothetical protein